MTTTPGMAALAEAMRLEQARIYGTTQRQLREAALAELGVGPLTADTAQEIEKRREIAASIDAHEEARVIDLRSRRAAS